MHRILVPCLVTLALLSACASPGEKHLIDSPATATPSPSASPSETQTPARDLPVRPAMQQSAPGAEAQVRYALEVIDYAKVTGDTEELLELSRAGCVPCAFAIDAIRAGTPEQVDAEHVVADSTNIEGNVARVDTVITRPDDDVSRSWNVSWNGSAWEWGSIVNPMGL